jgi:hypothetical protein
MRFFIFKFYKEIFYEKIFKSLIAFLAVIIASASLYALSVGQSVSNVTIRDANETCNNSRSWARFSQFFTTT